MRNYYQLIEAIKIYLLQLPSVNTVRLGNIEEVDLQKQNIYPLCQMIVGDAQFKPNTIEFSVKVLAMDSVFVSKDNPVDEIDSFKGVDNKQDVYNTMLSIVNNLQYTLKRGSLFKDNFHLVGEPVATPFEDSYGNLLTGWSLDFNVVVPNTEVSDCGDIDLNPIQPCIITFDNDNLYTFDNN